MSIKQYSFGFQGPTVVSPEDRDEIRDVISEIQNKMLGLIGKEETSEMDDELKEQLERIEKSLEKYQPKQKTKSKLLRDKAVELVVGVLLLIMSVVVLSQITHTRDIAGENQTSIGVANTRLENTATREDLSNMRLEMNAQMNEMRLEFMAINNSIQSLIEQD